MDVNCEKGKAQTGSGGGSYIPQIPESDSGFCGD